jgi:hypothetical protein
VPGHLTKNLKRIRSGPVPVVKWCRCTPPQSEVVVVGRRGSAEPVAYHVGLHGCLSMSTLNWACEPSENKLMFCLYPGYQYQRPTNYMWLHVATCSFLVCIDNGAGYTSNHTIIQRVDWYQCRQSSPLKVNTQPCIRARGRKDKTSAEHVWFQCPRTKYSPHQPVHQARCQQKRTQGRGICDLGPR